MELKLQSDGKEGRGKMSRKANWQFYDPDAYKQFQESLTPLVHLINGILEAPLPEIERMHLIGQLLSCLNNTKKRRAGMSRNHHQVVKQEATDSKSSLRSTAGNALL